MEKLIMNDAADRIIKIFRLYIIRMKYHQTRLAATRRYSKINQKMSPSIAGYSNRSFGSNESWHSGSGKNNSNNGNGINSLRKRSDNSFSSSNSVDKKSQNSASKSSKYFTTKNLKGFASKLLYGKPKSPIDIRGQTNKESSKILQRGQDEFNSSEFDNKEYYEFLKNGRPRKCSVSKTEKCDDVSDTSSPPAKMISKNKDFKGDNSPILTPYIGENSNSTENILRKSNGEITPKRNMKIVGKSLSTNAISVTKSQMTNNTTSSASATSTSSSTSISSSSFFSIHENRKKMNKELKDKSKTNYTAIKAVRKERVLKAKEDSYVLVAQKAYCLISSEEMQSSQFQVIFVVIVVF